MTDPSDFVRNARQDHEIGDLLREYDRVVARLSALGVDVKATDRANAAFDGQEAQP